MRRLLVVALAWSVAAGTQTPVAAQSASDVPAAVPAAAPMAEGEVRRVDREQGKLTLKHGPIASLDMPGMTMVFKVADPKMLDSLKPGDKVKFSASRLNGAITVTAVELMP